MSDWKFSSESYESAAISEAYAVNQGVVYGHDIQTTNPSHASCIYQGHVESVATAEGKYGTVSRVVIAEARYDGLAKSHTTGWVGHCKSAAGARMTKHYEANKAGVATGTIRLRAIKQYTDPQVFPAVEMQCISGSTALSADYHLANDRWSIYGSLHTSTGIRTVNETVYGFDQLDATFTFAQSITRGSNWTIQAETNDGGPGSNNHFWSAGTAVYSKQVVDCGVMLMDDIESGD